MKSTRRSAGALHSLILFVCFAPPLLAQETEPVTLLDEVVVTASPFARTLFEQAQPVSILTGENLELRLQPTLGETLNGEPGVSSTYFAPGASRPIIRGLGDDRIRVLQNGTSALDVSNVSPDHAVTTEPLTTESIEVVRGPATLLYGPNGVGGVVNVIDNRVPDSKLGAPVRGMFQGGYDSVNDGWGGGGFLEFEMGPIVFHLDGFGRHAEDLRIPGFARSEYLRNAEPLPPGESEPKDFLPNSYTESQGGAVGASYIFEQGFIGLAFSGLSSDYGTVAEPTVHIEMLQKRWDSRGAWNQPIEAIKTIKYNFAYADYRHTEFEGSDVGTRFKINGLDARLEIAHEKMGPFEGTFGYEGQQSDFSAVGAEAFLPPVSNLVNSVFAFEEIAFDKTRLQFGLRYDHQSNDTESNAAFGPAQSREFNTLSGSVGVVYTPVEDYAVALSAAYTQRAPTYVELFANGPHVATNAFEIGDSDLDPENSIGIDLTLRKRQGRITGSISGFYSYFKDFINLAPTGANFVEPGEDPIPIYAYDPVDAVFTGFELETTFHLLEPKVEDAPMDGKLSLKNPPEPAPALLSDHALDFQIKSDYVYAQDLTNDVALPRIPPFRLSAGLIYQWENFGARIEGQYAAYQGRHATYEFPTNSYFLLNASINYEIQVGDLAANIYVKGTNLTNEEARLSTSFVKDIAPLGGRGIAVGMKATF